MAELIAATMRRSADLDAEREANERLRELDRLKDDVVAVVTHELSTPISSIGGYLELILEQSAELDPELVTFLQAVERNTHRLRRLLDDLLVLLRVDAGELGLTLAPVDLAKLAAVEVEVADTGIGIAEADQAHLFERFFRASSATERGITGTGLGLAIVREIVEADGGRIACESEAGRGTTFRLRLPAAA